MTDTGKNVPESLATLLHQQLELFSGLRDVQMFPVGTDELPLPNGIVRYENSRGVFHYRPDRISALMIENLSSQNKENEFLRLGPFSKHDIAERLQGGEKLVFITEYTPMGIEVRSAVGTDKTMHEQLAYFEKTKNQGNDIVAGGPPERVRLALRKAH
jgi:hypothetical protein